jgi:hypothetical protein
MRSKLTASAGGFSESGIKYMLRNGGQSRSSGSLDLALSFSTRSITLS